jgi:hypothetical protein
MGAVVRRLLAVALLAAAAGPVRTQEEPRAVIERAVKALGTGADRPQPQATRSKSKGIVYVSDDVTVAFTGESATQAPDRYRHVLHFEVNGTPMTMIQVFDGTRGWTQTNGETQEYDEKALLETKKSNYAERVSSLVPLLKDKGYTLSALGETQVQDRPAIGVKVTSPGQPDVSLYFDKTSGLLVKTAYRAPDETGKKDVLHEIFSTDYRELNLVAADELVLKAARIPTDGPGLLDFFRKRTLAAADLDHVQLLIQKLGDDSFDEREKASASLVAVGKAAVPLLRQAAKDADPEIARRAEKCLQLIESTAGPAVVAAAARMVGQRKPAGATEVLLAYLPGAGDETVIRDLQAALVAVAQRDGKPDPALLQAAEDKNPVRRAAALAALGRDGGAFERQPGRRLYLDGLKRAMKVLYFRDGKKAMNWEVLDVQFFNKLEDSLFAKP